jgi:hypothetical protein
VPATRSQPILRHDIGDRATQRLDPCPCGAPPATRVEDRTADVLTFLGHVVVERAEEIPERAPGGKYRAVIPLARSRSTVRAEGAGTDR